MSEKTFLLFKVQTNGHFCAKDCQYLDKVKGVPFTRCCSLFKETIQPEEYSKWMHIRCDKCKKSELE